MDAYICMYIQLYYLDWAIIVLYVVNEIVIYVLKFNVWIRW